MNIKEQSSTIQGVIRRALDLGVIYLVLGIPRSAALTPDDAGMSMVTPFSTSGLHSLAITALITAAEEHGFDEEGDVVERLTSGSEKSYIKPLRTHVRIDFISSSHTDNDMFKVFHRLGIDRGNILSKITSALPSVIKIDKTHKAKLAVLLAKNNYIYPLKEGTVVSVH